MNDALFTEDMQRRDLNIIINSAVSPKRGKAKNRHFTPFDMYPTIVESLGFDIKRELFLQTYLKHFNANLQDCRRRGFAGIRQRWINYAYRLNASIMICQSSKTQTGIFKGIDEQGFLLLEHNGEISKIAAGDVFVPSKG